MIDISTRRVGIDQNDREKLIEVESKSTPNLRYVPHVYELFANDPRGEFTIAEIAGEVVGCAKFTVLPDGTAWVETLRVVPEYQGLGVGKRLYQQFFEVAKSENILTMRMYTGINNVVSKGLAEHFGFKLESTFLGASRPVDKTTSPTQKHNFAPVSDPAVATSLLMAHQDDWNGFLVMNRTFYKLTPSLCVHLAKEGCVYADTTTGSTIVLGARFMPEQALHIGHFYGNAEACINFAIDHARALGVPSISCLYPDLASSITDALAMYQFQPNASKFIVMRVDI